MLSIVKMKIKNVVKMFEVVPVTNKKIHSSQTFDNLLKGAKVFPKIKYNEVVTKVIT